MSDRTNERLRRLPKMDQMLERPEWRVLAERFGRPWALDGCRKALERTRLRVRNEPDEEIEKALSEESRKAARRLRLAALQRVVNATGVLLHTNLGRAPLGREVLMRVYATLSGTTNVELDLYSGERGERGAFVRAMLARLAGAEAALVVNNNAAAVLLTLSALAEGREVLVSRGELVQIGGGFRIPDVIQQGGARLREVGTTNVTSIEDYRYAVSDETGAILKVHLSNFWVEGFTGRPSTHDLSHLKRDDLPLVEDLGSGSLLTRFGGRDIPERTPAQVLADGADLVTFSGDKLLGACQAGIIAGRKEHIRLLARHPLMRAIRPDKLTYAVLQEVLIAYEQEMYERVAPWRSLGDDRAAIEARIARFRERHRVSAERCPTVPTTGRYGAGSLPSEEIESAALRITTQAPEDAAEAFRRGDVPVLGRVHDGAFILDFLTIQKEEESLLGEKVKAFLRERGASDGGPA